MQICADLRSIMNARLLSILASFAVASIRAESQYDQLLNEGLDAFKTGDFDLAIQKYNECIATNPKDPIAYNDRGLAYKGKKDFEHAIADFTKALQLKSDWFGYYNRGITHAEKGDQSRAISD